MDLSVLDRDVQQDWACKSVREIQDRIDCLIGEMLLNPSDEVKCELLVLNDMVLRRG